MHTIDIVAIADINECLDNNCTCSHHCINTEGSYHCECPPGYILQPNKHDCEGEYSRLHYHFMNIYGYTGMYVAIHTVQVHLQYIIYTVSMNRMLK